MTRNREAPERELPRAAAQRLARERRTVAAMLQIFCAHHHGQAPTTLCPECRALYDYALSRLEHCPFLDAKPACSHCQVHCYSRGMRQRIQAVMRYAGPRMLLRHPVLALWHLFDRRRPAPPLPARRAD